MIDLRPHIRSYLLSDFNFTSKLSDYLDTKAIFTRKPVPENVSYPLSIISSIISDQESDFIDHNKRTLFYDIAVYGQNDTDENFQKVEEAGFVLFNLLHRLSRTDFVLPNGYYLVQCKASSPLPAPVDDLEKVGRVVMAEFLITN